MAAICYWCHFKTHRSNREMRLGMLRAARRPTYPINSVNLVLLDLLSSRSLFAPFWSENSVFFKWLFTKMAVSTVSGRESEQELPVESSHLMLKNFCLCFRTLSSFEGNDPSLQTHSFSEDPEKCNKTGNPSPSISDFFTILMSLLLILADISHLPSDEAYKQHLSLPSYRLLTPCYECKPKARHCFDKIFIKAWFCCEKLYLFRHRNYICSVTWHL